METIRHQAVNRLRVLSNLNSIKGVTYAFSSRQVFGNMSYNYGNEQDVMESRARFLSAAGIKCSDLVLTLPVHGTNTEVVGTSDRGRGLYSTGDAIQKTDALITEDRNVALALNAADCAPIIIANTDASILSLVHAGRDGTNSRIVQIVLNRFKEMGYSDFSKLRVGIGPTVGLCYEQGFIKTAEPELWLPFVSLPKNLDAEIEVVRDEADPALFRVQASKKGVKVQVDLVEANISQLVEAGVPRLNIEASYLCTECNAGVLFSHQHATSSKRENGLYSEGRFMAVAQLV